MRYNLSDEDMAMMTKYWFDLWEIERWLQNLRAQALIRLQDSKITADVRQRLEMLINDIDGTHRLDTLVFNDILHYLHDKGAIVMDNVTANKSKQAHWYRPKTADIVQNVMFWTPRTPKK